MEVRDRREQSSHRQEQQVTNHEGAKAFVFFSATPMEVRDRREQSSHRQEQHVRGYCHRVTQQTLRLFAYITNIW